MAGLSDLIAEFARTPAGRDPNDMSDQFNTPLSPQDEARFQLWQKVNPHLGSTYDYDARGFWKEGAQQASNGHGGDAWKKPNHPTFSNLSRYSKPGPQQGGQWTGDAFWGSPANLIHQSAQQLVDYFKREEPGPVILPIDYNLPAGRR